ncbi:K+dependent Na+/exchanger related-protein [Bacteroidales bacterium 6E]|nr:K+dependent Na+/exchanger related-protein [Bacteroidales bacterium 6E]
MWYFILLIVGFLPLIYGANILVDSASSLAKRYNIPNMVIGLTIVAFGTSAPELVVNVFSAVQKNADLALGNVIGSNIFNVAAILGISAIIYPLTVKSATTWIEVPLALLAGVMVLVLGNDILIDKGGSSLISRIDGIVLLVFFLIFLVYNYQLIKKGEFTEDIPIKDIAPRKATLLVFAGLALLVLGGRLIVFSAVELATAWGMPERLIGLTIVSIGTSLPELATSVVAATKKNTDIAVGNIVGSNIFNIFFILGTSAVIYPVPTQAGAQIDMLVNILLGLLLFAFIFTGKGRRLERWEGILFVLMYVAYIAYLILG